MNVRRIGFVATLLARNGCAAITAAISPYAAIRGECRARTEKSGARFIEVWVNALLEVVEQRDTKGLYAKARAGLIKHFTGVSDPYEAPEAPMSSSTPARSPSRSRFQDPPVPRSRGSRSPETRPTAPPAPDRRHRFASRLIPMSLTHLERLEAESIRIIREVAAERARTR